MLLKGFKVAETVKLNKWEQEALGERLILINKKLAMKGYKTIPTESQIIHKILEMTINKIDIDSDGNIKIND